MAQTFPISHGARDYPARCSLGDLAAIERACGRYLEDGSREARPAMLIMAALMGQQYSSAEAVEPLRVALGGGGMSPGEFSALRDEIYEAEGLPGLAALSLQVMRVAFVGVKLLKPEPPPTPGDPPRVVKKKPRRSRSPSARSSGA